MAHGAGHPPTGPAGHIVYVGPNGNLYTVRPDGTDTRALTSDGTSTTPYAQPTWSPNGRGLLAVRLREGLQALASPVAGLGVVAPPGSARQPPRNLPPGLA